MHLVIQITYPVGHRPILYIPPRFTFNRKKNTDLIHLPSVVNSYEKFFLKIIQNQSAHGMQFTFQYFITIDLPLKIPLSKFRMKRISAAQKLTFHFQLIKLPHLLSFLLRK